MDLTTNENALVEASVSNKDWVKAAEIVLSIEDDGSWRESGLASFTAWMESLSTRYSVSKSWLWRAQQAAKYLPTIWHHHHESPADDLTGILAQCQRNISPSAICALATLANRGLSETFLRSVENAYFSGVSGVTELWRICTQIDVAKERKLDPEIHLALFRSDFKELFEPYSVRLISEVPISWGFHSLVVLSDGEGEPFYAGLRLGSEDRSPIPRSLDYLLYLVRDEIEAESVKAASPKSGVVLVDLSTSQLTVKSERQLLEPIGTKRAALRRAVLNHLLSGKSITEEARDGD